MYWKALLGNQQGSVITNYDSRPVLQNPADGVTKVMRCVIFSTLSSNASLINELIIICYDIVGLQSSLNLLGLLDLSRIWLSHCPILSSQWEVLVESESFR